MSSIIGQESAISALGWDIRSGRVSHAYLFSGPKGSGRTTIARLFAKAANCTGEWDSETIGLGSCNACSACRKMQSGSNPDFHLIAPDGASIKIDQIREMQSFLALKANEARYKVWVIEPADRLTEQAANSLLKVLEEPLGDAIIILIAQSPTSLLPTVVSRCRRIRFGRVPITQITSWLQKEMGLEAKEARAAAMISEGLPGQARIWAFDKELQAYRAGILSRVRAGFSYSNLSDALNGSEDMLAFIKAYSDRQESSETQYTAQKAMEYLASWCRDIMALKATGEEDILINCDYVEQVREDAESLNVKTLMSLLAKALSVESALGANANARLAIDDLMLSFVQSH